MIIILIANWNCCRFVFAFTLSSSSLVTEVKPETVSIYQVKRTEKDSYKKRSNWRLKDLKFIDGKDETNVRIDNIDLAGVNDMHDILTAHKL